MIARDKLTGIVWYIQTGWHAIKKKIAWDMKGGVFGRTYHKRVTSKHTKDRLSPQQPLYKTFFSVLVFDEITPKIA